MGSNPLLDLPDSGNPLLALVPEKKKPTQTEGVLGTIGDFLVDNLGGVSATMRDNAKTGVFAQDASNDGGFLDRAGSLIERGAASVDQGIYNFLGGLGSQKARDAAAQISGGTTGRDIAGTTSWDNVNSAGSLGSYVFDAGIESLPAMGAIAVPYAGPAIIMGSQTGNIASERAQNNNSGDITMQDIGDSLLPAALSTALDRFGFKGIKNPAGKNIAIRIAGAATREGLTEAAQSGIEYGGGTIGTLAGFDTATALDQMLAGGVAGAGMGGAGRVALEPVDALQARRTARQPQPAQGTDNTDWEGSLDDLLAPEQAPQTPANPLLALPAPVAYADSLGDTAIGSDGLNQLERTSAARRTEAGRPERPAPVENGGSVIRGIFGDDARITSGYRGPDHPLSKKNPNSWHAKSAAAVDMAPIPGVTFAQAKKQIEAQGYTLIEAINEVGKGRTKNATGDHWHFVIGKGGAPVGATPDNPFSLMPDVEIPGADGSLLNRGDQGRIAKIDTPEMSGQDYRIPESEAQPEVAPQQDIMQQAAPAERAPLPDVPPTRQGQISQVIAPRVGPVDTMFELRDIAELIDSATPGYDPSLQPRDRAGRAASGAQVASIAGTLDPRQLADSRLASTGAPIIGPDGQVESGNGRIAALRQVYAQFPEKAATYRQMITEQGLDATGLQFPVLVRRRTTQMTPEQRMAWTRAANERDTMAMSSTEQATADARSLPDTTLSLYRGGTVTAAANRDFVRAFIERAVSPAERNAMIAPDGSLSTDGARRIRFALMARAYGDSELIGRIAEDTDTNIAAIGKALLEAAPAMAKLRAGIEVGDIPPQYDISANIAEAARMVARSRDTGQSLQGMLAQTDAFADRISAETEAVLNLFYRDAEMKRPRSAVKIADDIIDYARLAETQAETAAQGDDMFGNAPTLDSPATLLQRVRSGEDGEQPDLLAPAPDAALPESQKTDSSASDEQSARPSGPVSPTGGPDGDQQYGRAGRSVLARGQLRALGITAELRVAQTAALIGRTAKNPKELAEIAQVYRDPRYETFRIIYTKGDTVVYATGVSSRSVSSAPIMPADMDPRDFYQSIRDTMKSSGADGYYLLHNHPSGDPTASSADKDVTRQTANAVPGFRAHIVINSGKYARIVMDAAGKTRTNIATLSTGPDKILNPSIPHPLLGQKLNSTDKLAVVAKGMQSPGYLTIIGTDAKRNLRVIVDYPAETAKRDVRSLMAMARRIQRESGAAALFLIGPKSDIDNPTVARAIKAGVLDGGIDTNGNFVGLATPKAKGLPESPARSVAQPAYHGSPHIFDKFSLDAIGTGEGAQAYGWGLYFAGKKEIAQYYREVLSSNDDDPIRLNDKPLNTVWTSELRETFPEVYEGLPEAQREIMDTVLGTIAQINKVEYLDGALNSLNASERALFNRTIRGKLTDPPEKGEGRLYEVDIPDDGEYLLWDEPLGVQPETVKKALVAAGLVDFEGNKLGSGLGPVPSLSNVRSWADGQKLYKRIVEREFEKSRENTSTARKNAEREASLALLDAGIAGIKYLDGGSRSNGDGSYNYVIFDDSRVRIDAVEEEKAAFDRETIDIDGTQRPTVNSNGQPLARDDKSLRAFWKWFGDSKVVDAEGRPLVVYHGTTGNIDAFKGMAWGAQDVLLAREYAYMRSDMRGRNDRNILPIYMKAERVFDADALPKTVSIGSFFNEALEQAEARGQDIDIEQAKELLDAIRTSARREESGPSYGRHDFWNESQSLFGKDGADAIQKMFELLGFDGVQMRESATYGQKGEPTYGVFAPEQVKSVENRGTFDASDPRILMEEAAPFDRGADPGPRIASGLVDADGISRDVQKIRDVVGNPVETLKGVMSSGFADNARAVFYSMDSRLRAYADRFDSPSINALADMFYARPGTGEGAVTETYHEAVEREGLGRAAQSLRILAPFIGDKAAMERITKMLRLPAERQRGRRAEAEAAAQIAKLLKDTLEYRRAAGEDIGEVTTGYFPRWLDVEKVVQNRNQFLARATQLFADNGAPNPRASAEAWLARTFDQYAGIDGGLDLVDLFHDTREAGPGRKTTKPRKFGEDADRLLGEFYQNDAGEVLTAYFMGGAKRAEETRRFGNVVGANDGAQMLAADTQLKKLFDKIQDEIRESGQDGGEAIDAIAGIVARNLGRIATPPVRVRGAMSFLHTASQLGTLDRATITSLSEAMMGFVRGGAQYGLPMLIRSVRNFVGEIRKAPLDEAGRMAEFLGIAQSALVSEALAARNGYERAQTSRRAQKVQQGFFRATGLEQWTTGTRRAATAMGQEFIYQTARDVLAGKRNSAKYLNELGVGDPQGFARWLMDGGNPSPEELVSNEASANARAYRGALVRFVNQTIMKPTRAEKPKWASSPYGSLVFALMSYSYGFKKNVLDRTGRMGMRAIKEGDPSLLYPAFGMAALLAMHTVINQPIREALLGGGREDDEEGIQFLDVIEALDKAGLFGAASPLLNAMFGLKYRRGTMESLVGPTVGRPFDVVDKTVSLGLDTNSEKTNNAERAAAASIYDVVLEPALEAYGVTRFKGAAAAGVVWGSGNREGGVLPSDREVFIEAVAGPKEE